MFRAIVVVFLLTGSIFKSFGQASKAEARLDTLMQQMDVAGLSVAVVKGGKLIYTNAFGYKDLEKRIPLATDDIFRIASISKSFSATAIMQLVKDKKLSLDDDFGDLVGFKVRNPKYPNKKITLRMVLSHTSSINDSQGYFNLDVINPTSNPDYAKSYNGYAPGADYQYCNLNFNMVGAVIERLTGERFDNYVRNHILNPLDLYGGYCVDSLDNRRFATLYEFDTVSRKHIPSPAAYAPRREEIRNYKPGYSTPIFSPTGGMKISAPDLARYMIMHMNYGTANGVEIIRKKYARQMQVKLSDKEGYGLALRVIDNLLPGKTLVGHTGSAYGLYSAMFFDPKEKFGIVVITNGCNARHEGGMNVVVKSAYNILYENLVK